MSVLTSPRLTEAADQVRVRVKRFKHALGIPAPLALAVVVLGQLIATEIQLTLGTQSRLLAATGAVGVFILLSTFRWTSQLPSAVADAYGKSGNTKLPARRGLVLLVGLDSALPNSAAATLFASAPNLEYLALVGTVETGQNGIHTELVNRVAPAAGLHVPGTHVRSWSFGNAESISDAEQATSEAIRWMRGHGLDVAEIVVDVSAGRRPMSRGAEAAADAAVVEAQYLSSAWDSATNKPISGTQVFKVIKTYHE